jgi:CheY-like chemotaxis protein
MGDDLRLRQVLLNLLSNAVKFTESGAVRVDVSLDMETPSEVYIRLAVEDTGIGIPLKDQQRIFAPFMQVDASTTRRHGGTGLGLTIASDLIRAMGGSLSLKSEPARGSTFHFTIPLAKAPASHIYNPASGREGASPERAAPLAERPESLRVLLAEDVPTNQLVIRRILEKRGHRVQVASNGREAVDQVQSSTFDIVLMDVQMPEMDGFQATALIRELPDLAAVPIVALTAHAMPGDRERCMAAGMDGYLTKPIDAKELVQVIENCSRQSVGSPARE